MAGLYYEIFAKIFKGLSGVNIVIPGEFKTTKDENGVKCSIGAKQGHLFFLSKSLLFVQKPVLHIRFDEITEVVLH